MNALARVNFGMSTPAAPASLQDAAELDAFIALLVSRDVRTYLEIGARYGGTFERVMRALPVGSVGVAVDFPGADFGDERSPEDLIAVVRRLRESGRSVRTVFGPSCAEPVVRRLDPMAGDRWDAILIDGDHSYDGVKRDFEVYAPMGRIIALHDIAAPAGHASKAGHLVEVPRFWAEIKPRYRHREIVTPGSAMGIGVIWGEA